MNESRWLAVLWCVACGHVEQALAAPPFAQRVTRAAGLPSGGEITDLAVTERGDAALTIDALGDLRLWPALDGTTEPVPVTAAAGREVALARTAEGLVATILDGAGTATVLAFAPDGTVRGHVQLPSEVAIDQVVADDSGVLVRRRDQVIERYSPTGVRTGRLAAREGERIARLASRRGGVIVGIAGAGDSITSLRPIVIGTVLSWGDAITLPQPMLPSALALSPDHTRVAGVIATNLSVGVIDVAQPGKVRTIGHTEARAELGFADDDMLAVAIPGVSLAWLHARDLQDPWGLTQRTYQLENGGTEHTLAVSAGFALAPMRGGLAVARPGGIKYLGWADAPTGLVTMVGAQIGMGPTGGRYVWLDDRLAEVRQFGPNPFLPGISQAIAVGEHELVLLRRRATSTVELVDTDHPDRVTEIASYAAVQRIDYAPEAGVLSIAAEGHVDLYAIDAGHATAHYLTAAPGLANVSYCRPLDPARADGAVLIAFARGAAASSCGPIAARPTSRSSRRRSRRSPPARRSRSTTTAARMST
jgi:hypothetical protein